MHDFFRNFLISFRLICSREPNRRLKLSVSEMKRSATAKVFGDEFRQEKKNTGRPQAT
jgi:hypothetical protein